MENSWGPGSGGHALQWDVAAAPICDSPRFSADWREFDELRFWAYLEAPVNFSVPIVFGAPGGYDMAQWKLDWTGWKEQRIKLSECSKAHEPVGWDQIQTFGFRAPGFLWVDGAQWLIVLLVMGAVIGAFG